eukprot:CAMPEP_0181318770 /NCGR_PEP_ID=MMETSP1101-20121128/17190_1 /TAXON_ID=46948 /ORGANISM="Rhodomonas abbreviata, Strain Caron Lab Isolate" /LENGTH=191 /DNA_ID=CAMNT_0023426275 /DNA_START=435 /DNA_END=1010 /DNA_ORIENTATION=+
MSILEHCSALIPNAASSSVELRNHADSKPRHSFSPQARHFAVKKSPTADKLLKTVEESEHSDHISFDKTDSFTLSGEPKPSAQTEEPPVMSWEPSASEEELSETGCMSSVWIPLQRMVAAFGRLLSGEPCVVEVIEGDLLRQLQRQGSQVQEEEGKKGAALRIGSAGDIAMQWERNKVFSSVTSPNSSFEH